MHPCIHASRRSNLNNSRKETGPALRASAAPGGSRRTPSWCSATPACPSRGRCSTATGKRRGREGSKRGGENRGGRAGPPSHSLLRPVSLPCLSFSSWSVSYGTCFCSSPPSPCTNEKQKRGCRLFPFFPVPPSPRRFHLSLTRQTTNGIAPYFRRETARQRCL